MNVNERIEKIRNAMPVTRHKIYLNTGTSGPLTIQTVENLNQRNNSELAEGRASAAGFVRLNEAKVAARKAIARLVKATPQEIALTNHTTAGMNIVIHGFNWQPGDEVITTTLEHEGGLLPLYVLKQRYGVVVKMVDLSANDSDEDIVAKLEAAIAPRARLMLYSHVAWNTGQRLPMAKITAMGHKHHVLSLVDAAQSVGAIPLDLPASGVDFYAIPGQKWLCGPEGTGALYIRQDRVSMVSPTFVGYVSLENPTMYDYTGYFMPAKGARRYEVGTVYRPGIEAMVKNLGWLEEEIGWTWIHDRILHLAAYARSELDKLQKVSIITPPGSQAGLVTFNLEGYDPARVVTKLAQQDIIIRFLPHPYALRVSTGFYNTEDDIDRLVEALKHILADDPENLPEYVSPW